MRFNGYLLRQALCVFLFVMVGLTPIFTQAKQLNSVQRYEASSHDKIIYLVKGKADLIKLPENVADVLVANPSIVDVQALQANKLYLVGSNIGDTNILIVDKDGNLLDRINIHVTFDTRVINDLLKEYFPKEETHVSLMGDQFVLSGNVSTPSVADRVTELVTHYVGDVYNKDQKASEMIANMLQVRGEKQVMLRVKIVEASRNILKEIGLDTSANDPNETSTTKLFTTSPPVDQGSTTGQITGNASITQAPIGVFRVLRSTGINGIGDVQGVIRALERDNLANILAEPNLTAVSGEEAGFLAGGEFPVPSGLDQNGNLQIEYKSFGVSLNFRPVVMSENRINLQVNTEVSSLDFDNTVNLQTVTIPGLDIRRAETTVELASGGGLMIAGLLESKTTKSLSRLPGAAKTPVLGDLISSRSFQRNETELLVLVTAYLVDPFNDAQYAKAEIKDKNITLASANFFKQPLINALIRLYGNDRSQQILKELDAGEFGYMLR
jgi:pilus assembly protein CpaC